MAVGTDVVWLKLQSRVKGSLCVLVPTQVVGIQNSKVVVGCRQLGVKLDGFDV